MKLIKITNPHWLGVIGPKIADFVKRVNVPGITYESLFTYFAQTIQFGGDMAEFNIVYDDDSPIAFAHWMAYGLPHVGKVGLEWVYSWTKKKEATDIIVKEFINFGKKKRAPIYGGYIVNEKVFTHFVNNKSNGLIIERQSTIQWIARLGKNEDIQ